MQLRDKEMKDVCVYVIPFFLTNLTASAHTGLPECGPGPPLRVLSCVALKRGYANVAEAVVLVSSTATGREDETEPRLSTGCLSP